VQASVFGEPMVVFDAYDRVFQFEKTTYRIHKHTLVITLNVRVIKEGSGVTSVVPNTIHLENDRLKEYLLTIANHFDFFDQILSTRQVVQYIFNKREVESMLLKFS
jgi:hypothetical protein